jgi:hypothetical protein
MLVIHSEVMVNTFVFDFVPEIIKLAAQQKIPDMFFNEYRKKAEHVEREDTESDRVGVMPDFSMIWSDEPEMIKHEGVEPVDVCPYPSGMRICCFMIVIGGHRGPPMATALVHIQGIDSGTEFFE